MTDYDELARLAREAKANDPTSSAGARLIQALADPDVILALMEERRVLREALLDIGTDHEDCSLRVSRGEDSDDGPGWWVLYCDTHDSTGPLLDFAALQERTEATR